MPRRGVLVRQALALPSLQEIFVNIHHRLGGALAAVPFTLAAIAGAAHASSHREAPFITTAPKVDATDFYMFRSYENGRGDFVTLIANYQPLQDAYGGPNYFSLDPNALYEIHIDNNGDAKEDLSFQFRFKNTLAGNGAGVNLNIGGKAVGIPLIQAGTVSAVKDPNLQLAESYSVQIVRGDRRSGTAQALTNAANGSTTFDKPVDNIGSKTIADYAGYAAKHVYAVNIPGCNVPGRMFVGQRQDPFAVNLGTIFDLVNAPLAVITDPALIGAVPNTIGDKNVSTLALEVHKSCLTRGDAVIGAWTTASLRQARLLNGKPSSGHQASEKPGGAWTQVSRLGMPLVNEVVIGLKDKDRFNASKPSGDAQFANYVTNPTLPALLEIALAIPGTAPTNFPRNDLVVIGMHSVFEHHHVMTPDALRVFASEYRLQFPIAIDRPQENSSVPATMQKWALRGTPTLLVFGRDGELALNHFGHLDDLRLGALLGGLIAHHPGATANEMGIDQGPATAAAYPRCPV